MVNLEIIGIIRSPYQEKFGVPRQPNLVPMGKGELHLIAPFNHPDCVKGLDQFSHLWLLFLFTQTMNQQWHNMVRPPRLGGNEKVGVFASRSTFRPNPIGLSAVELHDINVINNQVILTLGSIDLVDQTPIIDIKPYIPYADSYPQASAGYAQETPPVLLTITFSPLAEQKLQQLPELKQLIIEVIQQDPRPAYKQQSSQIQQFGMTLKQFNIRFQIEHTIATILDITP